MYFWCTVVNLAAATVSVVLPVLLFFTWFLLGIAEAAYAMVLLLSMLVARKEM